MENLLTGLNEIDWQGLNASHVAKWLEDLTSDDRSVRLSAYNNLEAKVMDKGSESWESYGPIKELVASELPLLVSPFLIQLLQYPSIQDKENILMLLTDLANKVYLDIDKLNLESDRAKAYQIYQVVQKGVPVYQQLYETSDDEGIKQVASGLLRLLGKG